MVRMISVVRLSGPRIVGVEERMLSAGRLEVGYEVPEWGGLVVVAD